MSKDEKQKRSGFVALGDLALDLPVVPGSLPPSTTARKEIWTMPFDALATFHTLAPKAVPALENDLVFKFFAVFSRFECALKRSGFLKTIRENRAAPDWRTYAKSLHFVGKVADQDFQKAVTFLLADPPKNQIVVELGNGKKTLDWEETPVKTGEIHEEDVLDLVRIVRNNLFHGGKCSTGPIEEPARNKALLEAVITILHHCLTLNDDVSRAYDDVA